MVNIIWVDISAEFIIGQDYGSRRKSYGLSVLHAFSFSPVVQEYCALSLCKTLDCPSTSNKQKVLECLEDFNRRYWLAESSSYSKSDQLNKQIMCFFYII